MSVWYVSRDGQEFGPLSTEELRDCRAAGRVVPGDFVWREGMADWADPHTIAELSVVTPPSASRPPPPPRQGLVPLAVSPATPPALAPSKPQAIAPSVKQGGLIGSVVCFLLGVGLQFLSVWTFLIYVPLFLVSFILGIIAIAQRRVVGGVAMLLLTLVVPVSLFFYLSMSRTYQFARTHVPGYDQNGNVVFTSEPPTAAATPSRTSTPAPVRAALDPILMEAVNFAEADRKKRFRECGQPWLAQSATWKAAPRNDVGPVVEANIDGIWICKIDASFRRKEYVNKNKIICSITTETVSAADRLNGVEWRGRILYSSDVQRFKDVAAGSSWRNWEDTRMARWFLTYRVRKAEGSWIYDSRPDEDCVAVACEEADSEKANAAPAAVKVDDAPAPIAPNAPQRSPEVKKEVAEPDFTAGWKAISAPGVKIMFVYQLGGNMIVDHADAQATMTKAITNLNANAQFNCVWATNEKGGLGSKTFQPANAEMKRFFFQYLYKQSPRGQSVLLPHVKTAVLADPDTLVCVTNGDLHDTPDVSAALKAFASRKDKTLVVIVVGSAGTPTFAAGRKMAVDSGAKLIEVRPE